MGLRWGPPLLVTVSWHLGFWPFYPDSVDVGDGWAWEVPCWLLDPGLTCCPLAPGLIPLKLGRA